MKTFVRRLPSAVCFFLLVASISFAQFRAGVQGSITDSAGALVPGAKVTLTSQETNTVHTVETSDSGVYTIVGLAPGKYNLTVEKTGFSKQQLSDIQISAEQVQAINVVLEVGQVSQTITVDASVTPAINTESAEISGTISEKEVHDLPSIGRDPYQLARLAPGVFGDGTTQLPGFSQGSAQGIFAVENGVQISANGGRQNSNGFQLDGVLVNSTVWGGAPVITPNEESVKEVKVTANNYSAENGRNSGAQVQVVSQNGTNDLHGSAFFKWHRPGLNAYEKWNGPSPVARDNQRFNQLGGSIGGPVVRNHLFAFFSYETQRDSSNSIATGWYQTPQFLQNAGSASSNARRILSFAGQAPNNATVVPQTCAQIGLTSSQCQTVSGGLDIGSPLTSSLGSFDPTHSSTNFGIGNGLDGIPDIQFLQTSSPSSTTNVQYNGRMDYQATSKDLIAFSSYFVPVDSHTFNGARALDKFNHSSLAQAWAGIWTRTISPTIINEARFNRSGWAWDEVASNPQIPWGIPSLQFNNIGNISLQGFGAPGASAFNQRTYDAKDSLTKVQGSHNLKFGADISWSRMLDTAPWAGVPTYNFYNLWDFANDAPYHENSNFNPVTGTPSSFSKTLQFNVTSFFVQDDWKVRPNLTLNLGMRWEDFSPITEQNGNISNVVLGSAGNVLGGLSIRKGGNLTQNNLNNWGPQIGFAWSPKFGAGSGSNKGLVLRGGFGVGYNLEQLAITSNGRFNPPFQVSLDFYTPANINYKNALSSNLSQANAWPSNPAAIETFNSSGLPTVVNGSAASPVSLTGFPWNSKATATYRFSLDAEYDLGHNWIASLGYQGSQSRHMVRQTFLNYLYYPQSNPLVNSLDWYSNDANSHFNALLGQVQHHFSHSFQIDAQYRFSTSLDAGSQDYAQDLYPWDLKHAYGPSDFDAKNNFKLWGLWTPSLFHSNGFAKKVLGGWTVSGILTAHSGFPWTPKYCSVNNQIYSTSGQNCAYPTGYNGKAGTDTSNAAFQNGTNFGQNGLNYFTIQSGTVTGIPALPGINRNSFRGPGFLGNDVQLAKAFGFPKLGLLGENAKLNFQANFYNMINKLNLQSVNGNNTTISNGGTPNPTFGESPGAINNSGRVVELQIRLSF